MNENFWSWFRRFRYWMRFSPALFVTYRAGQRLTLSRYSRAGLCGRLYMSLPCSLTTDMSSCRDKYRIIEQRLINYLRQTNTMSSSISMFSISRAHRTQVRWNWHQLLRMTNGMLHTTRQPICRRYTSRRKGHGWPTSHLLVGSPCLFERPESRLLRQANKEPRRGFR